MPVKVGKGKKGSKGKKKKKGKKGKKKKGSKNAPARLKKIAGELSTDQLLQYRIMKEDRTSLQERCKLAEDKNALLETKLKQISEDQTDIFENLRSKVEKPKYY
jgi:FtsZ-binding cell division protein ZapB